MHAGGCELPRGCLLLRQTVHLLMHMPQLPGPLSTSQEGWPLLWVGSRTLRMGP